MIAAKNAATMANAILAISDDEFRAAFNASAMKRAKVAGLRRNAAVVLGTRGSSTDVVALAHVLAGGGSSLVNSQLGGGVGTMVAATPW